MRRYAVVQKARDADVFGILVGTLGVGMSSRQAIMFCLHWTEVNIVFLRILFTTHLTHPQASLQIAKEELYYQRGEDQPL
jgi:diphthamide synthase subunit DPH2